MLHYYMYMYMYTICCTVWYCTSNRAGHWNVNQSAGPAIAKTTPCPVPDAHLPYTCFPSVRDMHGLHIYVALDQARPNNVSHSSSYVYIELYNSKAIQFLKRNIFME